MSVKEVAYHQDFVNSRNYKINPAAEAREMEKTLSNPESSLEQMRNTK
jgi:hypothetical protein